MSVIFLNKSIYIIASVAFLCGCNTTDVERFLAQEERYVLSLTTSTLTAYGATQIEDSGEDIFRCPSVSGMASESGLTVFRARAHVPYPHFTLSSAHGIRSDATGAIAVSLSDFPVGLLDIYERCNSTASERYVTSCPYTYEIVETCSDASENARECVQVYSGTHQLVVTATADNSQTCMSEESDRSPYVSSTTPEIAYACDAFSPIKVDAAYRGDVPADNCCSESDASTLDFCLRPCGCRTLTVQIVPKTDEAGALALPDETVRIAVFANVSGHKSSFRDLLASIKAHEVDFVVSLGNLTSDGTSGQWRSFAELVDEALVDRDGQLATQACQTDASGNICCDAASERRLPTSCNAVVKKTPFISGLGENELSTNLSTYNALFGASNVSTFIGNVQILLLDTADGGLSSVEHRWLDAQLSRNAHQPCTIPAPTGFDEWPTLFECAERLDASKETTCRECIGEEAFCIPPSVDRSETAYGPENCVCVPATSKICPDNQWCSRIDGTEGVCQCTRDGDCGIGARCVDGTCQPPLRLVFSYTPPFDSNGLRNNAFTSKSQAANVMSLFSKSNVAALFSGRSVDYDVYSKAGVKMYITGGGGAPMASFSDVGHHWLLVEIPNAYSTPGSPKIEVVKF